MNAKEIKRLQTIAELIDREADSWAVSFAGSKGEGWIWDDTDPDTRDVHARFIRLESAAEFLRGQHAKLSKSNS